VSPLGALRGVVRAVCGDPRAVARAAVLRVLGLVAPAHRTNASGNNQSQR